MLYVDSVLKSLESREEEKTCHSSVAFSLKFFSSSSSLQLAPNILICQPFPRMYNRTEVLDICKSEAYDEKRKCPPGPQL